MTSSDLPPAKNYCIFSSKAYLLLVSCLPGQHPFPSHPNRPACQTKPSSQDEQPKLPDGSVPLPHLTHANSTSSLSTWTSSASQSSNSSFRRLLQRRNPIIPDTVKLPSGILSQSAALGPSQTFPPSGNQPFKFLVRRREQPGRRKDSTQSLYIDSPESDLLLHVSSCPPSASSSSSSVSMVTCSPQHQHQSTEGSKGPRRFSDPDVPYMEEDVWSEEKRKVGGGNNLWV